MFIDTSKSLQIVLKSLEEPLLNNEDYFADLLTKFFIDLMRLEDSNNYNNAFKFKFMVPIGNTLGQLIGKSKKFDEQLASLG